MSGKHLISNIILFFTMILFFMTLIIVLTIEPEKAKDDNKVLIEINYSNYAWVPTNKGIIICNNGDIYKYDISKEELDYNMTLEEKSKYLISKGQKTNKKLSQSKLKSLKNYLKNYNDDNLISKNIGCDIGMTYYTYYDYENNTKVVISATGDTDITNNHKDTKNILNIIKKYYK